MLSQRSANLQRTSRRLFRAVKERKRHPVPGRHPDEFAGCFCRVKTLGIPNDLVEFLQRFDLLVDQQFRIADHVN